MVAVSVNTHFGRSPCLPLPKWSRVGGDRLRLARRLEPRQAAFLSGAYSRCPGSSSSRFGVERHDNRSRRTGHAILGTSPSGTF
jgi:hypothetical protein